MALPYRYNGGNFKLIHEADSHTAIFNRRAATRSPEHLLTRALDTSVHPVQLMSGA